MSNFPRLQLDLLGQGLAERAGLHRNYVGGIERGERNVGLVNVGKLAAALEVSVAELFRSFRTKPPGRRSRCSSSDALRAFGVLLNAHVRFEESELFPAYEQRLADDVLETGNRGGRTVTVPG